MALNRLHNRPLRLLKNTIRWRVVPQHSSGKYSINMCWWKGTLGSICQRLTHHCKPFAFWHAHSSAFKPAVCSPLLPQGQFLSHLTHLHILTTDKRKEKHTSLYSHTHTNSLQKPFGAQPRTQYRMTGKKKSYCSSFKKLIAKTKPKSHLSNHNSCWASHSLHQMFCST